LFCKCLEFNWLRKGPANRFLENKKNIKEAAEKEFWEESLTGLFAPGNENF
jgi:hypothetical protein